MKNSSARPRTVTVAQRALIIQRVIVDGWTSAKAGATFDVPERLVDAWVADYRRDGMASLRVEIIHLKLARPVRAAFRRIAGGLRRFFVRNRLASPSPPKVRAKEAPSARREGALRDMAGPNP